MKLLPVRPHRQAEESLHLSAVKCQQTQEQTWLSPLGEVTGWKVHT